ncbi:4Fe-4S dicluster domain-containing protein [Sphingomonas profundi]|uniref:4Fe-4S dicluster domain-containing protein n=1 Tax=Alterirhizorhabdus profundi TaxID=2681549 RepID=UPI0018D078E9|nr:4Fe-4S dicluster domain-containing protein [Sphingomonas profundi]
MTPPPIDRRTLLGMIAAGAAATVAGCSKPDETIHPMVDQPDGTRPGETRRYATALPFAGYGRGVTGLVVNERPVKLEGLAAHPASLGATDVFTEVSILDLYDPQRLKAPVGPAGPSSWPAAARAMRERRSGQQGGRLALLTGRITSPTLLARIAALKAVYPGARHVRWEPFDDDAALAGAEAAFGRRLTLRPRLAEADVILCLDADPLGPGAEQVALARAWATRRRTGAMPRLFAIEPSPTATGAMADARAAATPREIALACRFLHARLAGAAPPALPPEVERVLLAAVAALAAARGRALVLAGDRQPAGVHAFAAWLNGQLGAPIDHIAPVDPDPAPHRAGLAALARDMHAGTIDTLIVIDANPCYAAPPALRFAEAMARVPLTIAATRMPDETSMRAKWRLPLSHPLEGWHDWRAPDGTASIAQPLIRPMWDTRTPSDVVDLLIDPAAGPASYARVRETWASLDAAGWRAAVAAGIVADTARAPEPVPAARLVLPPVPPPATAIALTIAPSPALHDGRWSANAWAQECPDPLTKEVWGSSARMHPDDVAALAAEDGDLIRIGQGGAVVTLPVRAVAGQARRTVTLLAGYGRDGAGAIADGIGANAFALADHGPVRVERVGTRRPVVTTQHQFALAGELDKLFPVLAPQAAMPARPPLPSLLPNPPAKGSPPRQWAMAIDTDVCIGCNACVVACQAENNVPAIGPAEMAVGRDMHWLRVDRYETAHATGFQPVPCMQCEAAPCEPVCPVEASVHDAQGLNVQVYNRCVGTRTCQANCPYKVRRFNFRDYAGASLWGDAADASVTAQRNPDVSVRARGVMEKCTYCVQRISAATRDEDAGGMPGPVATACQSACPTQAIRFGTLDDAAIREARADPRHYALLEELGTRPRTTYLARRKNGG